MRLDGPKSLMVGGCAADGATCPGSPVTLAFWAVLTGDAAVPTETKETGLLCDVHTVQLMFLDEQRQPTWDLTRVMVLR